MIRIILSIVLVTLCCALASAELNATLKFDKRPTPSGMIYLLNDTAWQDAGSASVSVTQKDKKFSPRLIAAPKQSKVIIRNDDKIQHNVYADDKGTATRVDLGMSDPAENVEQQVTWDTGKVVKFGCRIHPEMQLWIASVPTKHHVCFDMEKTDKEKKVKIAKVPSGEQTYMLWLPRYDEMKVTIKPGETKTIDIKRKGKKRGTVEFTVSE